MGHAPANRSREKVGNNKWIKRLRRELKANPKKGAVFGVLMLVAVYFWIPLIWGWLSVDESTLSAAAMTPAVQQPGGIIDQAFAKPAAVAATAPASPWQQLVAWMESDARTAPALGLTDARDPFDQQPIEIPAAEVKAEEEPANAAALWTPEMLGLEVSSTVVGPRRSVAVISGRTYVMGDSIEVSRGGRQIALRVAEVQPSGVVLECGSDRFELGIPKRTLTGRVELLEGRN